MCRRFEQEGRARSLNLDLKSNTKPWIILLPCAGFISCGAVDNYYLSGHCPSLFVGPETAFWNQIGIKVKWLGTLLGSKNILKIIVLLIYFVLEFVRENDRTKMSRLILWGFTQTLHAIINRLSY